MEMASALKDFIDYLRLEKRYSRHTLQAYETDLGQFLAYLGSSGPALDPSGILPSQVRSWMASLKEKGTGSKTLHRKISALRSFFRFCLLRGWIGLIPTFGVSLPRGSRRLPIFVEEGATSALFNREVFAPGWEGMTHLLILEILYQTGMRLSELTGMKTRQFDPYSLTVRVLGKGNKERIIPIADSLGRMISGYLREQEALFPDRGHPYLLCREGGAPLYPKYVYRVVRKYLALVSTLEKKSPHVLRHTFATHLMNHGADLNAIKELLGHSSLASTQIYTHNQISQLMAIFQRAHPRA